MLVMAQAGIQTTTQALVFLLTIALSKKAPWWKKVLSLGKREAELPMYGSKSEEGILPSWGHTFHQNLQQKVSAPDISKHASWWQIT